MSFTQRRTVLIEAISAEDSDQLTRVLADFAKLAGVAAASGDLGQVTDLTCQLDRLVHHVTRHHPACAADREVVVTLKTLLTALDYASTTISLHQDVERRNQENEALKVAILDQLRGSAKTARELADGCRCDGAQIMRAVRELSTAGEIVALDNGERGSTLRRYERVSGSS